VPNAPVTLAVLTPAPEANPGAAGPPGGAANRDAFVTRPDDPDETRAAPAPQSSRQLGPLPSSAALLRPGDPFGPRYRILRVLGTGGMGIVYHAWDQELGEAVALKLIRSEISTDPVMAKELEDALQAGAAAGPQGISSQRRQDS